MVRKKVSSEAADPTLSAGLSYFVEISKYREHVAKYGDQVEIVSTYNMLLSVVLSILTLHHLLSIFSTPTASSITQLATLILAALQTWPRQELVP